MSSNNQIISEVLVDQSYWDESYANITPAIVPEGDQLRQWIERHVPFGVGKHCLEVGCYPARYLSVLGNLQYTLSGVDLTPRVVELKDQLAKDYAVREFIHANFLEFSTTERYDLVCSFGFIEHFADWQQVLQKHAELVKKDGMLVIETPNFAGWFQRITHRWFDRENYERHNIYCMNPKYWKELLEPLGFEIIRSEYFGVYEFWSDTKRHHLVQRIGLRILSSLMPLLKKIKPGTRAFSPYCGLIAVRKHG